MRIKKQDDVSLFTIEMKYAEASKKITWLRNLIKGLGYVQLKPTVIFVDS